MDVKGRVVVVSGGASGLGEACCRLMADNGAKVSILDMNRDMGQKLVSELGDVAIYQEVNVADTDNVQKAIDTTMDKFGAIHVAINCAGIPNASKVLTKEGPISMKLFNKVIEVNLMGTMNIIRSVTEQMVKSDPNEDGEKGVIINTSSGAAYDGQIGQAAYSASKAGIVGMTLPIARELANYGIRIMTIAPGLFQTPMVDGLPDKVQESLRQMIPFPKRLGKPIEFAMLCKQIVENPMLNGRTIRLDAAVTM